MTTSAAKTKLLAEETAFGQLFPLQRSPKFLLVLQIVSSDYRATELQPAVVPKTLPP